MMATVLLCVALSLYIHLTESLNATACHGKMLHLSCDSSNQVIALDNIYAIAIDRSTNCSASGTGADDVAAVGTASAPCCETDIDGHVCKMNYTGESIPDYHELCTGNNTCKREAAWQITTCSLDDFHSPSTYMVIGYHCVPTSGIVHIPSNDSAHETVVSIQNEGYPTSGLNASAGMCSVTASHNSLIAVSLLHLNITCQQYIDILDGSVRERIDCRHNTTFCSGTLYTSRNHFISLNWTSELTASGRLWIQFTGDISPSEAAGIGIGVLAFGILLTASMRVLYNKKHQLLKVGNHGDELLDSEFADALRISGTHMGSTAPTSVIPPRPRRLAPIEAPGTHIHH